MSDSLVRNLFSKTALPIPNKEHLVFLRALEEKQVISKSLFSSTLRDEFLSTYFNWIQQSKLNLLQGLETFKYLSYVHGTSQAFDLFYAENNASRFRCFKGEFVYHRLSWRNNYHFKYIEDDPLAVGDAVVLSLPFSNTGNTHPHSQDVILECEEKKIPVLIDCAYYGLARDIFLNLNFSCIKVVTFSLSKIFYGLDRFRIGIRCKRIFNDDPVDVFNSYDMINKPGAAIGLEFIKHFHPDDNQTDFRGRQLKICSAHDLVPSSCVTFGLSENDYFEFNRDGQVNRVCISNALIL